MQNKKLSEILADAIVKNDVSVVTHVPGFGGTQVFNEYNKLTGNKTPHSFNEEAAIAIAHTAAIVGKRSASLIKAHGLMKGANCLTDVIYADNTAGFVLFVFEDYTGSHSDSILKIDGFLEAFKIPVIDMDYANPQKTVNAAYLLSEQKELPVVVLTSSELVEKEYNFSPSFSFDTCNKKYKRNILEHVVHPYFASYQYSKYLCKTSGGIKPNYEESIPVIPEGVPEAYKKTVELYVPFFNVFAEYRGDIVTGDTTISSSFVLPPYNAIDIVTYMGGSIPNAIGAYLAGYKDVWALTGDFGFIAAGQLGITELVNRNIPLKIVLFNNKLAGATGGQTVNQKLIQNILLPYQGNVVIVNNPNNSDEIGDKLTQIKRAEKFQILVLDY